MDEIEKTKKTNDESTQLSQEESVPVYTSEWLKENTKIHGWLKFFLVALIISGIITAIQLFNEMQNYDNPLVVCDIILAFEILAWTVYIVYLFLARKPNAVFFALSYIILSIICYMIALITGSTNRGAIDIILNSVYYSSTLWIFSVETKEVIPKSFRKTLKRDWVILIVGILVYLTSYIIAGFFA